MFMERALAADAARLAETLPEDGIRPLVSDEMGCIRDEVDFQVIGIGSVILQHTIR